MEAKVVYGLEHFNYGDGDGRNGWWIVRYVLNSARGVIIDQHLVAQFPAGPASASDVIDFEDYCLAGQTVLKRRATIDDMREA
jgi:hypothetical protein